MVGFGETFTPLNILNGTPDGVPLDVSKATLPINQLKSADIKDVRSNSNVHRCKETLFDQDKIFSYSILIMSSLPAKTFMGSNRNRMGSNAITDQNQGGGAKKAGLGRPMAYTQATRVAFHSRGKGINNLATMKLTVNPNVHPSRPISSMGMSGPNTYFHIPGTR